MLVQAIKSKRASEVDAHVSMLCETQADTVKVKEQLYRQRFDRILDQFDPVHQQAILSASDEGASG